MFIIKIDFNYWKLFNVKSKEKRRLKRKWSVCMFIVQINCNNWELFNVKSWRKNRKYEEIVCLNVYWFLYCVPGVCWGGTCVLETEEELNLFVKLWWKLKEPRKKWKWGRQEKRQTEITENVYWLVTVLWSCVALNVYGLLMYTVCTFVSKSKVEKCSGLLIFCYKLVLLCMLLVQ